MRRSPLRDWLAAGFTTEEVPRWQREGFELDEASAWRRVTPNAARAAVAIEDGIVPEDFAAWLQERKQRSAALRAMVERAKGDGCAIHFLPWVRMPDILG